MFARLGKGILDNQELAEDMAITQHSKNKRIKGDTLIVCPMALLGQWNDELEPHLKPDNISVFVHYGGDRSNDPRVLAEPDVVLTTYDLLTVAYKFDGEISIFLKVDWRGIVLDEAHTIKNWRTMSPRAAFTHIIVCTLQVVQCLTASTTTEAEALLKWKTSFFMSSSYLDSWSLSNLRNMCNWRGIVCNGSGVTTVSEINLPNANLSGTLHHLNFTSFPSLTGFNITGNYFNGSIPPAIGDLSNLVFLDLSNNTFDGSIPPQIGKLRELQYLSLYYNNFSGVVPHQIGNLQKVWFLDLGFNSYLEAPDWSRVQSFPVLRHLSFGGNGFGPARFPDFILGCNNLTYLDLSESNLNGSIPESLFTRLEKLEHLDLFDNEFSGPLSPNNGKLSNLRHLDLSANNLNGSIPESLFTSLEKLEYLYLYSNDFSGLLSHSIDKLSSLKDLRLFGNKLNGSIPESLFTSLVKLEYLDLSFNDFSGPLSPNIGKLSNLKYLDLSSNSFQGEIPYSIGQLKNLQTLYIKNNYYLNSSIPSELGRCTNLTYLVLSSNSLFGALPSSLSSLTMLSELDLSENFLSAGFSPNGKYSPEDAGKEEFLGCCRLARSGRHKSWHRENRTRVLLKFFPRAHLPLEAITSIYQLALLSIKARAYLMGEKTTCFFASASTTSEAEALLKWKTSLLKSSSLNSWSLSNLRNMCNWRGIVCNAGGATTVSQINLPYAALSGTLHRLNFTSFPSLTGFNISGNDFYGSIPPAIGDLSNLVFLDLSNNYWFDGSIPPQIGKLRELQYLSLSDNNFSGVVPHQIGNLQKVCFLDLGFNSYLEAPDWSRVKSFPVLRHLSLAGNGFRSRFPDFILGCRNITYLDLFENYLSGSVPESLFTTLEKLEYLDLSYNEFSGPLSPNISKLSN
nr:receptor-like protein 12 [Ipomoea trifida]